MSKDKHAKIISIQKLYKQQTQNIDMKFNNVYHIIFNHKQFTKMKNYPDKIIVT